MKKVFTVILALSMCLLLASCGVTKDSAIDAFNAANTAFTEVADIINADPENCDQEVIDAMVETADLLAEYKEMLESDRDFTQEEVEELIAWFEHVENWVGTVKAELETP